MVGALLSGRRPEPSTPRGQPPECNVLVDSKFSHLSMAEREAMRKVQRRSPVLRSPAEAAGPKASWTSSCLRTDTTLKQPPGVGDSVFESMRLDNERKAFMYKGLEPNADSAHYRGPVLERPVHDKYTRDVVRNPPGWEDPLRFRIGKLENWFHYLDNDKNGMVSKKELYVALQRNPEFRYVMRKLKQLQAEGNATQVAKSSRRREEPLVPATARDMLTCEQVQRSLTSRRSFLQELWAMENNIATMHAMDEERDFDLPAFIDFFRRMDAIVEDHQGGGAQAARSSPAGPGRVRPSTSRTASKSARLGADCRPRTAGRTPRALRCAEQAADVSPVVKSQPTEEEKARERLPPLEQALDEQTAALVAAQDAALEELDLRRTSPPPPSSPTPGPGVTPRLSNSKERPESVLETAPPASRLSCKEDASVISEWSAPPSRASVGHRATPGAFR